MRAIAPGIHLIDVRFQRHPEYIGCYVLEAGAGILLIDPGPTSTLGTLEEGLRLGGLSIDNVTDLLLTHIHLDHAGAAGTIVSRNPAIRVHVHASGAGHMFDPGRLIASATRLYGDAMERLWGDFLPVPKANVNVLDGGETLRPAGREIHAEHTPGHAKHHIAYFDEATGAAFVGDVAGVRIDNRSFVMPVTPPPDIDLTAWRSSFEIIRARRPAFLCPTHYGPARPVAEHLAEHEERLAAWATEVAADLAGGGDDGELARGFRERRRRELEAALPPDEVTTYLAGGGLRDSWHGLARHLRRAAAGASA